VHGIILIKLGIQMFASGRASGDPSKALPQWYLSKEHLKRVADGCTCVALAAEAPRHNPELRCAFERAL
jgi:hypothetical protein